MRGFKKTFNMYDQNLFAELSGDFNPIHVDEIEARRYLFGSPVVHGIHLILWSLECWHIQNRKKIKIEKIKSSFKNPLIINKSFKIGFRSLENNTEEIDLICDFKVITKIVFSWTLLKKTNNYDLINFCAPQKEIPVTVLKENLADKKGELKLFLDINKLSLLFKNLDVFLSLSQISILLF